MRLIIALWVYWLMIAAVCAIGWGRLWRRERELRQVSSRRRRGMVPGH